MTKRVAIVGGGIAGLAAAYELQRLIAQGADLAYTLYEAGPRLGGIVETVRQDGFILECGPDGWVTEKPWARELAEELGLRDEIIPSNDAERVTWILRGGRLEAMPDNMRMMVPESVESILHSPLFSSAAREAYAQEEQRADELKRTAPDRDESVASFVQRHFGDEVLRVIGAPLLGGVFGGDVERLSVQAVMMPFVQMEREHGSLIRALAHRKAERGDRPRPAIFTTLRSGTGTLAERMVATLPASRLRSNTPVTAIDRTADGWSVTTLQGSDGYDHLLLALPPQTAAALMMPTDARAATLMSMPASSAMIAAFGYTAENAPRWPRGFGFLVPDEEEGSLLAATFADAKFSGRVPPGGRSVRAYFGGRAADALAPLKDETIAATAKAELERVLGPLPTAAVTVVRRWPAALPQYEVGHPARMAELRGRVQAIGALDLLGNGYRGVGLPDLVRDSRAAARSLATS